MVTDLILFSGNNPARTGSIDFTSDLTVAIQQLLQHDKVVVCLVPEVCIDEMKKHPDVFTDLKIRHDKRQLTLYFRDTESKPAAFINGSKYKGYGHLRNSIYKFLKHTLTWKKEHVFFIGISKGIFGKGLDEFKTDSVYREVKKRRFENSLLNLLDSADTQIDLRNRYIGNSESCLLVRQLIAIASQKDFPVLVLGESGTGKEVVARSIHECSVRRDHPFIPVNCSAIPTELFESELFGYKKGGHSTAFGDKKGLWELANGGTLFLDEIGDLALNHQAKILRAVEDGKIMAVGSTLPVKINTRIIAATNKNIDILATGSSVDFREDLYYRISTFVIRTPSLSSHTEDIPELAERVWRNLSHSKLSQAVLNCLCYMNWPGNVRSLKHFLMRLYAFFGNKTITVEHVQVLQQQDFDIYMNPANNMLLSKPGQEKDPDKNFLKIEYLLKAAYYCEDEKQRKSLLQEVRNSLDEME